jgi:hypothetical protein
MEYAGIKKKLKRRANLLYALRKKGIRCDTRQRTVFFPYGESSEGICQIRRLREEFGFAVQFEITQESIFFDGGLIF